MDMNRFTEKEIQLEELRQEYGVRQKDYFSFYAEYYEHLQKLMGEPTTDEARLLVAICRYGLYREEPQELDDMTALIWDSIKIKMDSAEKKKLSKKGKEASTDNTDKVSFAMLRTCYDIILELTDDVCDWTSLFSMYCRYGFYMEEPTDEELGTLSKLGRICWKLDKPHLVNAWINTYQGKSGGNHGGERKSSTPSVPPTDPPLTPSVPPTDPKVKEEVKSISKSVSCSSSESESKTPSQTTTNNNSSFSFPCPDEHIPTEEEVKDEIDKREYLCYPSEFIGYNVQKKWNALKYHHWTEVLFKFEKNLSPVDKTERKEKKAKEKEVISSYNKLVSYLREKELVDLLKEEPILEIWRNVCSSKTDEERREYSNTALDVLIRFKGLSAYGVKLKEKLDFWSLYPNAEHYRQEVIYISMRSWIYCFKDYKKLADQYTREVHEYLKDQLQESNSVKLYLDYLNERGIVPNDFEDWKRYCEEYQETTE